MAEQYRVLRRTKQVEGKARPVVYYQIRFLDSDGSIVKTKNLPDVKTQAAAIREAEAAIREGIIPGSRDPFALQYCEKFWAEDSPYFKSKRLRGRPLSESYRQSGVYGLKHFEKYLAGKKMSDLSSRGLQAAADALAESGVNPRSINLAIAAVRRPVSEFASAQGIRDPLEGVERYEQRPKTRGILTPEELKKIIDYSDDPRARLIVLLGALCGLRMGEARALRIENVDFPARTLRIVENVVFRTEGTKMPKCGSARIVPAPAVVLDAIRFLQTVYPGDFVIPNINHPEWPADETTFKRAFPRVLKAIGITDAERKRRNLVYHGLRHSYVSLMQAAGLAPFIVARLAGHKSLAMTERYTNADGLIDFSTVADAMTKTLTPDASTVPVKIQGKIQPFADALK